MNHHFVKLINVCLFLLGVLGHPYLIKAWDLEGKTRNLVGDAVALSTQVKQSKECKNKVSSFFFADLFSFSSSLLL